MAHLDRLQRCRATSAWKTTSSIYIWSKKLGLAKWSFSGKGNMIQTWKKLWSIFIKWLNKFRTKHLKMSKVNKLIKAVQDYSVKSGGLYCFSQKNTTLIRREILTSFFLFFCLNTLNKQTLFVFMTEYTISYCLTLLTFNGPCHLSSSKHLSSENSFFICLWKKSIFQILYYLITIIHINILSLKILLQTYTVPL